MYVTTVYMAHGFVCWWKMYLA